MGNFQGKPYDLLEIPDDPKKADTQQRRAAIYRRIEELGHPALFDTDEIATFSKKFRVSKRQIRYDMDAISDYVEETLGRNHIRDTKFVFEKAIKEAIDEGDWEAAAKMAGEQAEWLENRGAIDKEADKVEVDAEVEWRQFLEE